MKAVLIDRLGHPPRLGEREDPTGEEGLVMLAMSAASLNPIDIAIAGGRYYGGHPPLPYVPGVEAAATRLDDGRPVFVRGGGLGVSRDGTACERFAAPAGALIDLPAGVDPAVAAALGTAGLAGWLPIVWRARVQPGETVLVLGATGAAGRMAVQAARASGAGRVVAAGRNRAALAGLERWADITVVLEDPGMQERLEAACGDGADVVYDPLWGDPLVAALSVAKPGARVVHLGQSAGALATIPSAVVRGRQLTIMGFSIFAVPDGVVIDAYRTMIGRWLAGDLSIDVTRVPLAEVERAWEGTAAGAGKYVLVP